MLVELFGNECFVVHSCERRGCSDQDPGFLVASCFLLTRIVHVLIPEAKAFILVVVFDQIYYARISTFGSVRLQFLMIFIACEFYSEGPPNESVLLTVF